MTDLEGLWATAFREFSRYSRHEFRGAMNGVDVNMEVVRSRIAAGKIDHQAVAPFLNAAMDQMREVQSRAEAMHLFVLVQLGEVPEPDVAHMLKLLSVILVPAARGEGTTLEIAGYEAPAPTSAPAKAVLLALVSGLLALIKEGGSGACRLAGGAEPVVRFSHQSATAPSLGPAVTQAIATVGIRVEVSDGELTLAFPKYQ